MSRMSRLDLTLQKIKQYASYIIIAFIIVVIAICVHGQVVVEKQKHKNEVYDLKAENDSLKQTIDHYERIIK